MAKDITKKETLEETDEEILQIAAAENTMFYGLTNDYMFHAVLQTCEEALRGLLSALLDIPEEEIITCEIRNPILLGEVINEKTCILDIRLLLNGNRQINRKR